MSDEKDQTGQVNEQPEKPEKPVLLTDANTKVAGEEEKKKFDIANKYSGGAQDKVGLTALSSRDILGFAKLILLFLFVLVIFVFAASYLMSWYDSENEKLQNVVTTILDITKTAVPSIVTLVLGFYFGKRESNNSEKLTSGDGEG